MSPVHLFEFFIFSVCIHLFSWFTYLYYHTNFIKNKWIDKLKTDFDYIIVGSGSAGSLIAYRLATETNYTFIVLEAGGSSSLFHDIPAFGPLLHSSVYDWQYDTVPQKHACYAMENQKCKQTQGKIFGGSAKLNNMIHIRGNTSHYVDWFHGKYTKEYIEDQFNYVEKIFHLDEIQYQSKLSDTILNAAKELGYNIIKEFSIGFLKPKVTQKGGKRWTTSDKLLSDHIITNMMVERLIIKNKVCLGVHVSGRKLYARKGVIISAGTLNTPKILQLSGIGPADLLTSLDIPVVKDLPVGKNLQDHIGSGLDLVLFDTPQEVGMWNIMNPFSILQYFIYGNGPFTTPGCEALGFLSTKNVSIPDIQFMILPVGISADRGSYLRKLLGITDKTWSEYYSKLFKKYTATILSLILHPKSIGTVRIQSKDFNIPPLIDPNYLSDVSDVEILIEGLKLVRSFIESESMQANGAHLNTLPFPGCEHFEFFSNKYLECYIRHLTLTSYHPVGTCTMGLPHSSKTVVDTSFKVLGIGNLYIADGSVLPTLPSANINAAISLIASILFEEVIKKNQIKSKFFVCDNISPFHMKMDKCWIL